MLQAGGFGDGGLWMTEAQVSDLISILSHMRIALWIAACALAYGAISGWK